MCGRFTLRASPAEVARRFDLEEGATGEALAQRGPRYNIAPGQEVAVVRAAPDAAGRVLEWRRWGLVPRWAEDPSIGHRMINARAETAAERPAFREAFRRRRCIVPADSFYEWAGSDRGRQPYRIARVDGDLFGIAGLFETWRGAGGEVLDSCTLLTVAANRVVGRLHDRMPVLLEPDAYAAWLDPTLEDRGVLAGLLAPCPDERLTLHPVSARVNDVRNDGPELLDPAPEPPVQAELF